MEIAPVDVIDDARALLNAVNRGYLGDLWGNFGLHWGIHFFLTKSILRFFANGVEATKIHAGRIMIRLSGLIDALFPELPIHLSGGRHRVSEPAFNGWDNCYPLGES
jgi:hypothetical protein